MFLLCPVSRLIRSLKLAVLGGAIGLLGLAIAPVISVAAADHAVADRAAANHPATQPFTADANTIFLLEPDRTAGKLIDRTGHTTPVAKNAVVIADDRFGACLKLADGAGVTIADGGAFSLAGGMTLDAWVFLEQPPPAKLATLAVKVGSFAWDLGKEKLNTAWLVFPTEPVVTTTPTQYKSYPVSTDTMGGLMNLPIGRWVRLTVAYDEATGAITNMIDGVVDRHRYRYRGPEPMQCNPDRPLTLLQGVPNVRLGPVMFKHGRPRLMPPTFEAYANALPYEGKILLTLDHIDPDLPLPIDVTLIWEKPSGPAETLRTLALDRHARVDLELEMPTWRNVTHTLMVRASAGGRQVLSRDLRVSAAKPAGNVTITRDHLLQRDGKPLFPLICYHAVPEDFPLLAEIGFNVLINEFVLNQRAPATGDKYQQLLKESLDAAAKSNLLLLPAANSTFNKLRTLGTAREKPATLGWYAADEPWGDLGKLLESYNTLKLLEPDLPVVIVQNNYSRLQETAIGCDILGVDPYPIPNVSLRGVCDATAAAIRACGGRKPVLTVVPQYVAKIPTREELRCMAWLAVASGADAVGFYSWEDRVRDPKTNTFSGWYTKEHPEQVETLKAVVGEMRRLNEVLLARPTTTLPQQDPPNPAIHASLRSAGGKRYLVVANDSRQAETTTLKLADVGDASATALSGKDAPPLAIRSGAAKIELPPLGVAIYELPVRR